MQPNLPSRTEPNAVADPAGQRSAAAAPPGTAPVAPAPSLVDLLLLGRALGFGTAAVAAVVGLAWAVGLVPAGGTPFLLLGAGAALGAAMVAVWLHGRFLDPRAAAAYAGDARLMAGRVQSLLAAAFGAKLAVLVLGALALRQAGVKFEALATFCVTFAAASLVCQLATAGYLSRAIHHRPLARARDSGPVGAAGAGGGAAAGLRQPGQESHP